MQEQSNTSGVGATGGAPQGSTIQDGGRGYSAAFSSTNQREAPLKKTLMHSQHGTEEVSASASGGEIHIKDTGKGSTVTAHSTAGLCGTLTQLEGAVTGAVGNECWAIVKDDGAMESEASVMGRERSESPCMEGIEGVGPDHNPEMPWDLAIADGERFIQEFHGFYRDLGCTAGPDCADPQRVVEHAQHGSGRRIVTSEHGNAVSYTERGSSRAIAAGERCKTSVDSAGNVAAELKATSRDAHALASAGEGRQAEVVGLFGNVTVRGSGQNIKVTHTSIPPVFNDKETMQQTFVSK